MKNHLFVMTVFCLISNLTYSMNCRPEAVKILLTPDQKATLKQYMLTAQKNDDPDYTTMVHPLDIKEGLGVITLTKTNKTENPKKFFAMIRADKTDLSSRTISEESSHVGPDKIEYLAELTYKWQTESGFWDIRFGSVIERSELEGLIGSISE